MTYSIPRTYETGSQTVSASAFSASVTNNVSAIRNFGSTQTVFCDRYGLSKIYFPSSGVTTWDFNESSDEDPRQGIFFVPWKNLLAVMLSGGQLQWRFIWGYAFDKVTAQAQTDDRVVDLYYQEIGSSSLSGVKTRTKVTSSSTTRYNGPTGDKITPKLSAGSTLQGTPTTLGDTVFCDSGWFKASVSLATTEIAAYRLSLDASLTSGGSSYYYGDFIDNVFASVQVRAQ